MKALKAPLGLDNWCQRFCTQCNNITARQSLGWRSPLEHATSNMPDISAFCFEFYKPIWYFNSSKRLPDDKMEKTRYLCLADSSRDLHTYYIITEPKQGKPMILIQSAGARTVAQTANTSTTTPRSRNFTSQPMKVAVNWKRANYLTHPQTRIIQGSPTQ